MLQETVLSTDKDTEDTEKESFAADINLEEGKEGVNSALALSQSIQRQALALTDAFASADGTAVRYKALSKSRQLQSYTECASKLSKIDGGQVALSR